MYRILKTHPDVFMPDTKETLYFNEEYGRGRDWYLAFFDGAEEYRASGEISNTYIFSHEAPRRIRDYRSDMKLITCLRHPVDRAFSHYLWLVRNGEVSGSFEEVLEERPDLVTRGHYGGHLRRWLEHFSREQILVLPFWELEEDAQAFAARIFDFIGVDPTIFPDVGEGRVLGAMRPRSRRLAGLVKRAARAVRRMGFPSLVTAVKESPVTRLLYEPYERDEYPEMRPGTRHRLNEQVRHDVAVLTELTGVDFLGRWIGNERD